MDAAYFVQRPRRWEDLCVPHSMGRELPYEIVGEVVLSAMDYENFITDLRADRAFIESAAPACGGGDAVQCFLVRRCGRPGGVLVVPERGGFVGRAALYRFA